MIQPRFVAVSPGYTRNQALSVIDELNRRITKARFILYDQFCADHIDRTRIQDVMEILASGKSPCPLTADDHVKKIVAAQNL